MGEITLESIDDIRTAENAYAALSEEEQPKVSNYEILTGARDSYYELALVGDWCYNYIISFYDIESAYNHVDLQLNADMSSVGYADDGTLEMPGTWSVTDGHLMVDRMEYGFVEYIVVEENGKLHLQSDVENADDSMMTTADFHALLDEMFMIVDLAEVDINDYCEFYTLEYEGKDAWGTLTGDSAELVMIGSKAYDRGWCCYNGKDIAIEVLFPQYEEILQNSNGEIISRVVVDAHTTTVDYVFPYIESIARIGSANENETRYADITVDQLTFGRAKGTLYFVNLDYVAEFQYVDDLNRGITLTNGFGVPYTAWNKTLWNEEHPY